jgi:hypothetical protein
MSSDKKDNDIKIKQIIEILKLEPQINTDIFIRAHPFYPWLII